MAARLASFDHFMAQAIAHHKAGRLVEAAASYKEALTAKPGQGDALRLLGTLYLQTSQLELAALTLIDALKAQPGNSEILNNLGIVATNRKDFTLATDYLRQALQLKPDYAEALNNLGNALQGKGQLAEAITHYRQALQLKPAYPMAQRNLGRALRDAGAHHEALQVLQQALQATPDDIQLLTELGLLLHKLGQPDQALIHYNRALALRPDTYAILINAGGALRDLRQFDQATATLQRALQIKPDAPEALINLAAVYWDTNRLNEAVAIYGQALVLQPDNVDAMINLGSVLVSGGRHDEAKAQFTRALQLKPGHPEALVNLGSISHEIGLLDEALGFYDKALLFNPDHKGAAWRRGLIKLAYGEYEEGWRLYEAGFDDPRARGYRSHRTKIWDGAPLPGQRLLLWSEQGLGDSLQFVRYARLCKALAGEVIVQCAKPLLRLYQNSPVIDRAVLKATEDEFDAQASLMSLPHLTGTTLATVPAAIPYLHVTADVQAAWDRRFDGVTEFKVGLVWAGNAREGQINDNRTDGRRSLSLKTLRGLLAVEGTRFYSLQLGPAVAQIAANGLGERLTDYMGEVTDFMDTAAIVNNLDLVITVDTSVAHLAGGLGRPVWILSRYDACWRWLQNRPDSPWYPTARIFGQSQLGAWEPVVAAVQAALIETVSRRVGQKALSS